MSKSLLSFMLVLLGMALGAVEVKNKVFDVEIDPRGAVVRKLVVQGKKWNPVFGKGASFDDQIGRNQGPQTQGIEYTNRLDFEFEGMSVTPAGTRADFSVQSPAYPGLRLWKSYFFSGIPLSTSKKVHLSQIWYPTDETPAPSVIVVRPVP